LQKDNYENGEGCTMNALEGTNTGRRKRGRAPCFGALAPRMGVAPAGTVCAVQTWQTNGGLARKRKDNDVHSLDLQTEAWEWTLFFASHLQ
jgi:hypothetical protein